MKRYVALVINNILGTLRVVQNASYVQPWFLQRKTHDALGCKSMHTKPDAFLGYKPKVLQPLQLLLLSQVMKCQLLSVIKQEKCLFVICIKIIFQRPQLTSWRTLLHSSLLLQSLSSNALPSFSAYLLVWHLVDVETFVPTNLQGDPCSVIV